VRCARGSAIDRTSLRRCAWASRPSWRWAASCHCRRGCMFVSP